MSTTVPPFVYAGEYRGQPGLQGLPGPGSAAWTALQAVAVDTVRQAPDGSWIKSTAARTTRATFDATEAGFWQSTIATSVTDQAALSAFIAATYSRGAASSAAPTWSKIKQNASNVAVMFLGDSTGAIDYRAPRKLALLIAAQFPTHTVLFKKWVNQTDVAYTAGETLHTGTGTANAGGPFTITFYNASVSGANTYYHQSIRYKERIIDPAPSLVFWNDGFNEGALNAQNTIDSFQGRYMALAERVREWLPNSSLICVGQPPAISPNATPGPGTMEQFARRVERVCEMRGYGFINLCQVWLDYFAANPTTYFLLYENNGTAPTDGVHPSSLGGDLGSASIWEAIRPRADAELLVPRTILPSVFTEARPENLLTNGDFRDLDSSTFQPSGFSTVGSPTFYKDTTNVFDPAVGYSLGIVSTGGAASSRIYRAVSAATLARLKGRYVSVLMPVRLNNSAPADRTTTYTTYGTVTIDDGVTATRALYDSHSIGDWVLRVETKLIDPAATTLTVYGYCENITSTGTDVSIGGLYLVEGIIPRKAFSRIKGDPGGSGANGGAGGAILDFLSTIGANPAMLNQGATQNATAVATANAGTQMKFRPQRSMTLRKLRWRTGGTVGGNYDIAILDAAGNRLWSKGSTAWPSANAMVVETVTDLALTADTDYWCEFSADNNTSTALCLYAPSTGTLPDFWIGLDGSYVHRTKSSRFPIPSSGALGTASVSRVPVITFHEA